MEDLKLDLSELNSLLQQAKRNTVVNLLKKQIVETENKLSVLNQQPKQVPVEEQKKVETQNLVDQDSTIYTTITKYSFDQEGKKFKIFVLLDKVGEVPKENVTVVFEKQSFDLKIKGYQGQNLRLNIKKLQDTIDVSSCTFSHRNNAINIVLMKQEHKSWEQLNFKASPINTEKLEKNSANEDPQASLMNMMKEMYQSGDDEMKKTISQAWQKSQTEKGIPPGGF